MSEKENGVGVRLKPGTHTIFLPPGEGELIGDAPHRRVEILSDDDTLHATWSRFGPHSVGADLHVHRHHTDLFYVLDGELTVRLGVADEPVVVPAGTLARVPPHVVHGFRNGSDADVRYLNLHAPGQHFADYLRAMRDGTSFPYDQHPPPEDGGLQVSEAVFGGAGFVAERPGLRIELLADVEEVGVSVFRYEPRSEPGLRHLHRRHVESVYVLSGELTLTAGGSETRSAAGTWMQVPPAMPHAFACTGDAEARVLELHTPSCGHGAFVRALGEGFDEMEAAAASGFDLEPA